MSADEGGVPPIKPAVPPEHVFPPARECSLCGARANVENGFIAPARGLSGWCLYSPTGSDPVERFQWAQKACRFLRPIQKPAFHLQGDLPRAYFATTAFPKATFPLGANPVDLPETGGLLAWLIGGGLADPLADHLARWLQRTGLPSWLTTAIAISFGYGIKNPLVLVWVTGVLWTVLASASAYIGNEIVVLIPIGVRWAKGFLDQDLVLGVAVIAGIGIIFTEAWVRLSRRFPLLFGALEMAFGAGVAVSGLRDTANDYAAFFALVAALFTIIDGRQRFGDALDAFIAYMQQQRRTQGA
jgi:hypothetical protein